MANAQAVEGIFHFPQLAHGAVALFNQRSTVVRLTHENDAHVGGIAGEQGAAGFIQNADLTGGMAGGVDDLQHTAAQVEFHAVFHGKIVINGILGLGGNQLQQLIHIQLRAADGCPGGDVELPHHIDVIGVHHLFHHCHSLMHHLTVSGMQIHGNTGELLHTAIVVKMAVGDEDDQRLVRQFPDSFCQMADAAAGVDEGGFFFALHQECVDQLEFAETPGFGCELSNFVSVHRTYCSICFRAFASFSSAIALTAAETLRISSSLML